MVRRVPIGDFPLGKEEQSALWNVIDSGRISEHKQTRAFEEEYADWMGVEHCIAVSSGTAALMCGLTAMKVLGMLDDGGKVLIPALTFIATANAVQLCGLEPVFGDVFPEDFSLKPTAICLTHCDAVMPVHLMGYPADMDRINQWASVCINNVRVCEDAAEAHGSMYGGQKVGTLSLWSGFSFYIAHTVQAGEMGCVCTDEDEFADVVRQIKAHGRVCTCKRCLRSQGKCPNLEHGDPRFTSLYPGFNFKTMEFQTALARVQLRQIDENIERRLEHVWQYNKLLHSVEDRLTLPRFDETVAYMGYPLILKEGSRDELLRELEKQGVECRPLFGCIPTQQPAYAHLKEQYKGKLPASEYIGAQGFYIGCHQYLTSDDIEYAANTIVEVLRKESL